MAEKRTPSQRPGAPRTPRSTGAASPFSKPKPRAGTQARDEARPEPKAPAGRVSAPSPTGAVPASRRARAFIEPFAKSRQDSSSEAPPFAREARSRDARPRDSKPRASKPRDGGSRDFKPRAPRADGERSFSSRSSEGRSREPRSFAPRVAMPAPQIPGPAVVVNRRASDRLREGHLWVYATDVEHLIPADGDAALAAGTLATIADSRGIPLGTGLYSDASQIAARLVSKTAALPRAQYIAELRDRIRTALALRRQIAPVAPFHAADEPQELMQRAAITDSQRLIFAEADGLPGIVADRYANLVIIQLLTQGTAQQDVREALLETLAAELVDVPGLAIFERPDPRIRELEKLPATEAGAIYPHVVDAEPSMLTVFTLNGLRLHYDASLGQKTGAFLDQRMNYAAAASYAHGRALDVCTYQGGFALHLAQTCESVTGVDVSRASLEVADRNLALNPQLKATVDWVEADAFDLLRAWQQEGQVFDTIVLDPPAFAKSKRATEGAMRGYKELNLRAMQMLAPGGTLVTCSCSHHVSLAEFTAVVAAAATDTGRRVQVLETRAAAPDHPEVLTLPETAYLKCLICRVD